ncbi:MAG TPA: PQQ-binding-like beta-propeller repeat protein [Candidatus Limnocylindrales bacterium]
MVTTESGFEFGYATSRPGFAYVMWLDSRQVERVVAIDTATGRPLWEPTQLGRFGDTSGMMVSRDAILMMTEQRFVNDGDPATGKVMWERDYGFNDTDRELYDDVLVITWQTEGRTEALDLKTGRPRWTVNERVIPGGTNALRTREEFRFTGFHTGPKPPADRRIALQLADGRIQVRDVDTGGLVSERGGAGIQAARQLRPARGLRRQQLRRGPARGGRGRPERRLAGPRGVPTGGQPRGTYHPLWTDAHLPA